VVEVHGLFVYVRFEGVVGVWQLRQLVGHCWSPFTFGPSGMYCSGRAPAVTSFLLSGVDG
jgi:hypothetical protein